MGLSLEAVLVVPLCLLTVTSSVIAAEPLEQNARTQAIASGIASQARADAQHLYRLCPVGIGDGGQTVMTLESSPQKVLVICRLAEDQAGLARRWLTGGGEAAAP